MPVNQFTPFRSQQWEARIRHIEDHLVEQSTVEAASSGSGTGTGSGGGSLPPSSIPEGNVDFDPSEGHNHDGISSSLINGTQVELDFGSIPTSCKTFTVLDGVVEPGVYIFMGQSADAPTGRSQDENEMDPFICRAVAETGQFVAYINSLRGPVVGLYKFNYVLTAPGSTGT